MKSNPGCDSLEATSRRDSHAAALPESAGTSLIAALPGVPSPVSVRNTALCGEPPRYWRRWNLPSTTRPSHCFLSKVLFSWRIDGPSTLISGSHMLPSLPPEVNVASGNSGDASGGDSDLPDSERLYRADIHSRQGHPCIARQIPIGDTSGLAVELFHIDTNRLVLQTSRHDNPRAGPILFGTAQAVLQHRRVG